VCCRNALHNKLFARPCLNRQTSLPGPLSSPRLLPTGFFVGRRFLVVFAGLGLTPLAQRLSRTPNLTTNLQTRATLGESLPLSPSFGMHASCRLAVADPFRCEIAAPCVFTRMTFLAFSPPRRAGLTPPLSCPSALILRPPYRGSSCLRIPFADFFSQRPRKYLLPFPKSGERIHDRLPPGGDYFCATS